MNEWIKYLQNSHSTISEQNYRKEKIKNKKESILYAYSPNWHVLHFKRQL